MARTASPPILVVLLTALLCVPFLGTRAFAQSGTALVVADLAFDTTVGIAHDPLDDTFWVTTFIGGVILHVDAQGNSIGTIPFSTFVFPTAITYFPFGDSFLVTQFTSGRTVEIDRTGALIGLDLNLPVAPLPPGQTTGITSSEVHPDGGTSGGGSLYFYDLSGGVHEVDILTNTLIRRFPHPRDPDGPTGIIGTQAAGGIELVLDPLGALVAIELNTRTEEGKPVILRCLPDGTETGFEIPLVEVASTTGQVDFERFTLPASGGGPPIEAIAGVRQNQSAFFVIDGALPPVAQILGFGCASPGSTVELSWLAGPGYDTLELRRDGIVIATLAGNATSFSDTPPGAGTFQYELVGSVDLGGGQSAESRPVECIGIVGAGRIESQTSWTGTDSARGLSSDATGVHVLTRDPANLGGAVRIRTYTFDLLPVSEVALTLPAGFGSPTGLACLESTGGWYVLDGSELAVQEFDAGGIPVGTAIPLAIDEPDDEDPSLLSLAFDPAGSGGTGEWWSIESTRSLIQRLSTTGTVLDVFTHPDELHEPTPDPHPLGTFALGISGVPEIGTGFDQLETGGGTFLDDRTTHFVRFDRTDGLATGFEISTVLIETETFAETHFIQNTIAPGTATTFVAPFGDTRLLRVDRTAPAVNPVGYLACRQPDAVDRAVLTFDNHGPYDQITIERDGVAIATLPGTASGFTDLTPPPGVRDYSVIASLGGVDSPRRRCTLRVGPGALLGHQFLPPPVPITTFAVDPLSGERYLLGNPGASEDIVIRTDATGAVIDTLLTPFPAGDTVIALAHRPTAGDAELWLIAAQIGMVLGGAPSLRIAAIDTTGSLVLPPTPLSTFTGGGILPSVTSFIHDPSLDRFWIVSGTADTVWTLAPDGTLSFEHALPAAAPSGFLLDGRAALDAERGVHLRLTGGVGDIEPTFLVEASRNGIEVGREIPFDGFPPGASGFGLAQFDGELLTTRGWLLYRRKISDPVAIPTALTCTESSAQEVTLTWSVDPSITDVSIARDGVPLATLPATTVSFVEAGVPLGAHAYTVTAFSADGESGPVACPIEVSGGQPLFVRGDASDDGSVDIGDPITILDYLFAGGDDLACFDAGDANDDGQLNVADPIWLLEYLFAGGPPPPAPFPLLGPDPTADPLGC